MKIPSKELARITAAWERNWGDVPPEADDLAYHFPDRWVRLHSLPRSKRYPDTPEEYAILLDRHHATLRELAGGADGAGEVLVMTWAGSWTSRPGRRRPEVVAAMPNPRRWVSYIMDEDEPEFTWWSHIYLNRVPMDPDSLNPLLRAVADETATGVIIAPDTLEWLYHPYDGGADVLLPSRARRNQLAATFRAWLPPRGHTRARLRARRATATR